MKTKHFKLLTLLLLTSLLISCNNENDNDIPDSDPQDNDNNTELNITESEKDGFTIVLKDNSNAVSFAIETTLINTFHNVYPKMAYDFNPNTPKKVYVIIDPLYDGVAYADISKGEIVISSNYINEKPEDSDLFTHELMHIIQSYPYGAPGWLVEGIADYARHLYGLNNAAAGWSLPSYSNGQHYTDAYGVAANFLNWIKLEYDNEIINKLDSNLRNETYTYISWVENTGYTLPDLWLIYSGNPIGDIDRTIYATLKVSKENIDGANSLEGSLKAIDGDTGSKFLIFDYPNDFWMQQELSEKAIVNKYTLTSGNDVPERDPKNWTLSGSDDEQNWTELDSRSNESFADRNKTIEYTFDSTTAFKYYRISITENAGASIFQLSEWRLFKKK